MAEEAQAKAVIVVAPRLEGEDYPEGTIDIIADCGHPATLSPTGITLREEQQAETQCMQCLGGLDALREHMARQLAQGHGVSAVGSRDEIISRIGIEGWKKVCRVLGVDPADWREGVDGQV